MNDATTKRRSVGVSLELNSTADLVLLHKNRKNLFEINFCSALCELRSIFKLRILN